MATSQQCPSRWPPVEELSLPGHHSDVSARVAERMLPVALSWTRFAVLLHVCTYRRECEGCVLLCTCAFFIVRSGVRVCSRGCAGCALVRNQSTRVVGCLSIWWHWGAGGYRREGGGWTFLESEPGEEGRPSGAPSNSRSCSYTAAPLIAKRTAVAFGRSTGSARSRWHESQELMATVPQLQRTGQMAQRQRVVARQD